jgi:hypothetical protein
MNPPLPACGFKPRAERMIVLCTGGRTERGAMALLPELPEVCFVEVGDFTGVALRTAAVHGRGAPRRAGGVRRHGRQVRGTS